jgi:hypothetical protein
MIAISWSIDSGMFFRACARRGGVKRGQRERERETGRETGGEREGTLLSSSSSSLWREGLWSESEWMELPALLRRLAKFFLLSLLLPPSRFIILIAYLSPLSRRSVEEEGRPVVFSAEVVLDEVFGCEFDLSIRALGR